MYTGRVFNMAYRYTGRYAVSEELTQEIFLKIYQKLPSYKPGTGSLRNWIMRVGRNLIIDYYRSTKRDKKVAGSDELETLDFAEHSGIAGPFENLHAKERAEFLRAGLRSLNFELQEAVLLRDMEGFTYQEIAETLQIPDGTVKSRINRGRIELAKVLRRRTQDMQKPGPAGSDGLL